MSDNTPIEPTLRVTQSDDYNDVYANSVQIRMSVWDFQLVFGTMQSNSPEEVTFLTKQGIFLSPQQAKALFNVLGQNLAQYEGTFGELKLEPQQIGNNGPIN
jgi:hypothetical protein